MVPQPSFLAFHANHLLSPSPPQQPEIENPTNQVTNKCLSQSPEFRSSVILGYREAIMYSTLVCCHDCTSIFFFFSFFCPSQFYNFLFHSQEVNRSLHESSFVQLFKKSFQADPPQLKNLFQYIYNKMEGSSLGSINRLSYHPSSFYLDRGDGVRAKISSKETISNGHWAQRV